MRMTKLEKWYRFQARMWRKAPVLGYLPAKVCDGYANRAQKRSFRVFIYVLVVLNVVAQGARIKWYIERKRAEQAEVEVEATA